MVETGSGIAQRGNEIELAITIDILDYWDDDKASSNVKNVVNISQENRGLLTFGGENVEAVNPNQTNVHNFDDQNNNVVHGNIDDKHSGLVIQMIGNITNQKPNFVPKISTHKNVKRKN